MTSTWEPLIAVHAIAASLSLLFGAFQLLRRTKGGGLHRAIGRIWVGSMYVVIFTSFGIQTLNGGFSWLHALSVLTLGTVTVGLWAAVRRNIKTHKSFMRGSYFGILGAFGGVVAVPSRRVPQMAAYDLPSLIMWVAGLIVLSFAVIGTVHLVHQEKEAKRARTDEIERLRITAEAGLRNRLGSMSSENYAEELIVIRDAAEKPQLDLPLMRLFARFTPTAKPSIIRAVLSSLRKTGTVNETIGKLTDEHFTIYEEMMLSCIVRVYDSTHKSGLSTDEKRRSLTRLINHAMTNVNEGRMLLSIVEDRDLIEYRQVLEVLAQMKLVGPTAMAEGAL